MIDTSFLGRNVSLPSQAVRVTKAAAGQAAVVAVAFGVTLVPARRASFLNPRLTRPLTSRTSTTPMPNKPSSLQTKRLSIVSSRIPARPLALDLPAKRPLTRMRPMFPNLLLPFLLQCCQFLCSLTRPPNTLPPKKGRPKMTLQTGGVNAMVVIMRTPLWDARLRNPRPDPLTFVFLSFELSDWQFDTWRYITDLSSKINSTCEYTLELDYPADTCVLGRDALIVLDYDRPVVVEGYDPSLGTKTYATICSALAYDATREWLTASRERRRGGVGGTPH